MKVLELNFSDDEDDDELEFEIPLDSMIGGPTETEIPGGSGAASSSNEVPQEVANMIEVEQTKSQKNASHAILNGFR